MCIPLKNGIKDKLLNPRIETLLHFFPKNRKHNLERNDKRLRGLIFIFLLLMGGMLSAQNSPKWYAKNLTTEDGLPSSTVYHVYQDSKGFIWISTDKGVAKYNGYDFECFSNEDGLTDNDVFTAMEDPNTGYIWFNTFSGGFCYYDGERMQPHPLNDKIKEMHKHSWAASWGIDLIGNLWFTSANRLVDYSSKIDFNFYKVPPSQDTIIGISPDSTDCIAVSKMNYVKVVDNNVVLYSGTVGHSNHPPLQLSKELPSLQDSFLKNPILKLKKLSNGRLFAMNKTEALVFDKERVHYFSDTLSNSVGINDVYELDDGNFLLGTSKGALVLGQSYQRLQTFFRDVSISNFLKDRDGNYWFSSLSSGVFIVASLDLNQYLIDEFVYRVEYGNDSSIWVFSWNGNAHNFVYDAISDRIVMKASYNDKEIKNSFSQLTKRDSVIVGQMKWGRAIKSMKWKGDTLLVGARDGFHIFSHTKPHKWSFTSKEHGFSLWTTTIEQDSYGRFWVGTLDGLYRMDSIGAPCKKIDKITEELRGTISDIVELAPNCLLIGTDGNGLFYLEDNKLSRLSSADGLSSNFISSIHVDSKGVIWVGTNTGINCLTGDLANPTIQYYNTNNGFPMNDIRFIKELHHHIVVGGRKGIAIFKDVPRRSKVTYHTYLHHVDVNNKLIPNSTKYEFAYDENSLSFHFRTIRFNQMHEYLYRLVGLDTTWQKSKVNMAHYHKLPPGNYIFEAKVANSPALEVPFTIHPHFTQTWWFIIALFVKGMGLIIAGVTVVFRYLNYKERLKRKISDLEHKALRSQMNPHFVFNAMNSIMYLIINNDSKSARRYLSQFSKLMRFVLENSKHNFITLKDEIATLQSYVDLEQLRYGAKIQVHWDFGNSTTYKHYKIPPMFVQPMIENALMHGLAPKREGGDLWLRFKEKEDGLYVIIEDNGIGRVEAQAKTIKLENSSQKSTAISNIKERIENINLIYKTAFSFVIEDLYDEEKACGTKVTFYIPPIRNEEDKNSNYR